MSEQEKRPVDETAQAQAAETTAENTAAAPDTAPETAAQTAADNAAKSETAAKAAQTAAANSQSAAETAKDDAQTAKLDAQKAWEDAERAKLDASASADSARQESAKALEHELNAQSAKVDAQTAKTDAQAARDAIVNMIVEAVTLETGKPATVSKSLVNNVYKLVFGLPRGNTGAIGPKGATGNGISDIVLKSGNHAPGTSDVYTITMTDGTTFDFLVYNGANGTGGGDMLAATYDPHGKAQDIFAYADAKSNKAVAFTVTLSASGWSVNEQTVSDSKFVTSGYAYTVCPAGDSFAGYAEAVIYADDVTAAGKMTFHCNEAPTVNLTVNILRTEAAA